MIVHEIVNYLTIIVIIILFSPLVVLLPYWWWLGLRKAVEIVISMATYIADNFTDKKLDKLYKTKHRGSVDT